MSRLTGHDWAILIAFFTGSILSVLLFTLGLWFSLRYIW